ncbi:MAG TPA: hypothetical protein VE422_41160 [Terriglobia bacterium]|nr:hypothetical protein [Terriglobia bacterium]
MKLLNIQQWNEGFARIAVALTLLAVPVLGQKPVQVQPPMGKYVCLTSRFNVSPIQGPVGPILTITYDPSVLGILELDGKGAYKMESNGKSGRYTYEPSNGRFTFTNGPLEAWPTVFEEDKNSFSLRLSRTKDTAPNAKGPGLGENFCTLK